MLAFLAIICINIPTGTAIAQQPILASDAYATPQADHVSISEDGKILLFAGAHPTSDFKTKEFIAILPVENPAKQKILPLENSHVLSLEWVNNTHFIANLFGEKKSGQKFYGFSKLVLFDSETLTGTPLFPGRNGPDKYSNASSTIFHSLPNDPDHFLVTADSGLFYRIHKVNYQTRKIEEYTRGSKKTRIWLSHSSGEPITRIDYEVDGKSASIFTHPPSSKKWKRVARIKLQNWDDDIAFRPIAVSDDTTELYMLSRRSDDELVSLKTYNIAQQKFTKTILSHDKLDFNTVILDKATQKPIGARFDNDPESVRYISSANQLLFTKNLSLLKAEVSNTEFTLSLSSYQDRDKKTAAFISTPTNIGTFYLLDKVKNSLEKIIDNNKTKIAASTRPFTWKSGGHDVFGFITSPQNRSDDALPMIVLIENNTHYRITPEYSPLVSILVSRGYHVFRPNYHGVKGYGRQYEKIAWGDLARTGVNDIVAGISALNELGIVSNKGTCIVGSKYGGLLALLIAMGDDPNVTCAASIDPVIEPEAEVLLAKAIYGPNSYEFRKVKERVGVLSGQRNNLKFGSLQKRITEIKNPSLIGSLNYEPPHLEALSKKSDIVEFMDYRAVNNGFHKDKSYRTFHEVMRVENANQLEVFLAKHLDGSVRQSTHAYSNKPLQ